MPHKDGEAGVIAFAFNNKVYVTSEFGGSEDNIVLSFDPSDLEMTNTIDTVRPRYDQYDGYPYPWIWPPRGWSDVTNEMKFGLVGHWPIAANYLVCLNGKLYAIGSYADRDNKVYNPDSHSWRILDHKLDGIHGRATGACTMMKYALP